jgi:1-phosphofructokinase
MPYPGGVSDASITGLVTLTPSPAIDRTYRVPKLLVGGVNRATSVTEEFAGKGVNVSRNLLLAGIVAPAVVPLHPRDAEIVSGDALIRISACSAPLRVNITSIDEDGVTTKINQSASELQKSEWSALITSAVKAVEETRAGWILIAGTIPPIVGGEADIEAIRAQLPGGVKIALDTSGALFDKWARSGLVDCVKPNVKELGEAVGRELHTLGDVVDAAEEVASWGVSYVMVSMGADGFLGYAHGGACWAMCDPVPVLNTIGAGDASVSGFFNSFLRNPDGFEDAVAMAAQWGSQKVQQATSQLSHLTNLPVVRLRHDIDRQLPVISD